MDDPLSAMANPNCPKCLTPTRYDLHTQKAHCDECGRIMAWTDRWRVESGGFEDEQDHPQYGIGTYLKNTETTEPEV